MPVNMKRKLKVDGHTFYHGIFAFTTTAATATVVVPCGRVLTPVALAIGSPASDEVLSVSNTVAGTAGTDDAMIVGENGSTTLTITRTGASKTSGLKFALMAIGY